jgi:hypothetical protein
MTGEGRLIKAGTRKRVRAQPKAPKAGALLPRPNPPNTAFRRLYERGDLPLRVDHHTSGNQTKWEVISSTTLRPSARNDACRSGGLADAPSA